MNRMILSRLVILILVNGQVLSISTLQFNQVDRAYDLVGRVNYVSKVISNSKLLKGGTSALYLSQEDQPSSIKETGSTDDDQYEAPQQITCGEITVRQGRVISSQLVVNNQAPYQVLLSKTSDGSDHFCSGVIIDAYTILTTARCVKDDKGCTFKRLWAIMGDVSVDNSTIDRFSVEIKNIRPHRGYKILNGTPVNDIAMLKLEKKLIFSRAINSVCLPSSHSSYMEKESLTVAGWGYFNEDQKSDKLRIAKVYMWNQKKCKEEFGLTIKLDLAFCAKSSYEGPCLNDWGAPVVRKLNGRLELVGLFSSNKKSKEDNCLLHPGLYTKISSYLKWINNAE